VPEGLFKNTAELLPDLDVSYAYVLGLKPKHLKPKRQKKDGAGKPKRVKKKTAAKKKSGR